METVEHWEFNIDSGIATHLPCSQCWTFTPDINSRFSVSEKTKEECFNHQKICFAIREQIKIPRAGQISREEWEDNIQRSHEKDRIDKKRDDIFRQIFN